MDAHTDVHVRLDADVAARLEAYEQATTRNRTQSVNVLLRHALDQLGSE